MDKKIFFLHIPRTAGTTVNTILQNNFSRNEILRVYTKDEYAAHRYVTEEHLKNIKIITGHLLLETTNPPMIYNRMVNVITLLREPVSRLISEYNFLKTWKNNNIYSLLNGKNISFKEYIQSKEDILFYRGKNFMTRCISNMNFENNLYPENALSQAKKNIESNFIFTGIQERFDESLVMLCDIINITNILYEKRNVLNGDIIEYQDEESLNTARYFNRADIELYNFACDVFSDRIYKLGSGFQQKVKTFQKINKKYQNISLLLFENVQSQEHNNIILDKDSYWQ